MLLVGSRAAQIHYPDLWDAPRDVDLIGTFEDYQQLCAVLNCAGVPLARDKFVIAHPKFGMIEVEIAWPGSSGEALLHELTGANLATVKLGDLPVRVAPMPWLYALKYSHRYKKNSPHFLKTLRDVQRMKRLGFKIPDKTWLRHRERETYIAKRPSLMQSKRNFFAGDGVVYKYDHDTIHLAMAHLGKPAYMFYISDEADVMCSRAKWRACSQEVKLYGVLEEAYVLALERSQIPFPERLTPRQSFDIALMKVCTSITSGWFRRFAYNHYDEVCALYSNSYMDRFKAAVASGVVRELKEEHHE
jgi:hypothetical protein